MTLSAQLRLLDNQRLDHPVVGVVVLTLEAGGKSVHCSERGISLEVDPRGDGKGAASSPQRPENISVGARVGNFLLSVRSDDVELQNIVHAHAEQRSKRTQPPSKDIPTCRSN